MTKIHCPDCAQGFLRKAKNDEEAKLYNYMCLPRGQDEIVVICDICQHSHVMKDYNFYHPNDKKIKTQKIKGYGTYHYRG